MTFSFPVSSNLFAIQNYSLVNSNMQRLDRAMRSSSDTGGFWRLRKIKLYWFRVGLYLEAIYKYTG